MKTQVNSLSNHNASGLERIGKGPYFKRVRIKNLKSFNREQFLNIDHETNRILQKETNEPLMRAKLQTAKNLFDKNPVQVIDGFKFEIRENFLCNQINLERFYK